MPSSFSSKLWWVSLCYWLWARLQWIWVAIVIGLPLNIAATWLISRTQQFNLTGTPIEWLGEHLYVTIPSGSIFIILTIVTGLVATLNDQSDQQSLPSTLEKQEAQNRDHFLKRLRRDYSNLMKQSLPENVPLIDLSFHREPDLVQNNTSQPRRLPGSALPAVTSILQAYEEADGELLILGEPGAGKTTLLLQLARDLRDRAEKNPKDPLPVIVNLSTWAGSVENWLIEEIARLYSVPSPITAYLVKHNKLLPLLDGLDEVPNATRSACVEAIHKYKHSHFGPLVVCCRASEYSVSPQKLKLRDTVTVQPLEEQQINAYFQNAGSSPNTVKETYKYLSDLVKTPLMLYMLILTYKDRPLIPTSSGSKIKRIRLKPVEEQQKQLLDYYLDSRLKKYNEDFHISPEQVKRQLTWLALQMQQRNQKIFYIEHMQPDWLQDTQTYERYAVQLPGILMGVLVSLLVNALLFNSFDPVRFIAYAFIGGHIGSLFSRVQRGKHAASRRGKLSPNLVRSSGSSILMGVCVWLCVWLVVGQIYTASDWLHNGFATGLCCAVSSFLLSLLFQRGYNRPNLPSSRPGSISTNSASWGKIWQELIKAGHLGRGILVGMSVGLTFTLGTGLFFTQQDGQNYGVTFGIRDGLAYGLTFGLIGTLLSIILVGKDIEIHPTEILTWSWRSLGKSLGRREHWGHALLVGLTVGSGIGMSLGLSTIASQSLGGRSFGFNVGLPIGLNTSLSDGLAYGLTFGIAYWLLVGLFKGLSSDYLPPKGRIKPNEGIWRSARFSMWAGLNSAIVSGFIGFLSMVLYFGLHAGLGQGLNIGLNLGWDAGIRNVWSIGLHNGLVAGLQVGLFGGLLACALTGGLACLRHCVLRLLLWRSHNIPFNYPRFLDRATRCIILHKVGGGGYEFFHDLLLKHLLPHKIN